ncbi:surface polysaccharide polymerase [Acetobacter estunensis NRIC 0472]|uniref:Polysaccharide polymerase n=1 Tax=Acetobacter estunensis TaxID=104097 RepID=A0A967BB26_9PROT|nr:polysaccharide polymerase [Acetobacter estunensis]NHO53042.1 polysaccharide polymerase [Acetobacter estunensis]GBQ29766.1 surface polysaccharide polymerase [Acetobacter estunensis NRIC 0472]
MTTSVIQTGFLPGAAQRVHARAGVGVWLVVLSAMFNLIMCFINTHGWLRVNATQLAVIELLIMMVGMLAVRRAVNARVVIITALVIGYMVGAKLINPGLSFKFVHDLAIIWIFFELGKMGGMEQAQIALRYMVFLILACALVEFLFPVQYGQQFNIWQYYVQKGGLSADTVNYSNTTSFVSGSRSGSNARTYFPSIFGGRRIASIFLEPVSIGNVAGIIFCWCLATSRNYKNEREIGLYLAVAAFIVLGDSRFATMFCLVVTLVRFSPFRESAIITFLMPFFVMIALTLMGSLHEIPGWLPRITHDDFSGRLLFSGQLLDYWGLSHWFALSPSPVYTADTGYAYVSNSVGLIFASVLWFLFSFSRSHSNAQRLMRTCLAVYFVTSLSIGAGIFTIKTASLLWFLYGATASEMENRRVKN